MQEVLPNPFFRSSWVYAKNILNPNLIGWGGASLLPDIDPWKSSWASAIEKEAKRVSDASGWNPKLVKLEGDLHMVDLSFWYPETRPEGVVSSIMVIEYTDHPFLEELNKLEHVPKAVKAIYRKEVRLKHLRATEYFSISGDITKAEDSWESWKSNQ